MKKLRWWFVSKLFNKDECYLLHKAVLHSINVLNTVSVTEKWANKGNIDQDVSDLRKLGYIFIKGDY